MDQAKSEFFNSIIKDRIQVLQDSEDLLIFRTYLAPGGGQRMSHYHSKLNEKFKIIQGELTVVVGSTTKVLIQGDEQMIYHMTKHRFYNTSKSEVIFDVEVLKPEKMMNALQIMYGLVQDGKTNKTGLPTNIFHTAIGIQMMDAYAPTIPFVLQKIGISSLTMLGRFLGIEKKLLERYCTTQEG